MGISVEAKSASPLRRRPSKGGEEGNRESIGRWRSREADGGRVLFTAGSRSMPACEHQFRVLPAAGSEG